MGKQVSLITFTGKLGNMIGYMHNGKPCLRSIPDTVGRAEGSRHASDRLGTASTNAALIRKTIYGPLDIQPDGRHVNRLTTLLIPSGGSNMSRIIGFRFNKQTGTDRFFTQPPKLSEDNILHIPAQKLRAPRYITSLEVKVIATRINFTTRKADGVESALLVIDARVPFNGAAVSVDIPGEDILVITLQVRGMKNNIPSENRKYLAADIVAVQTSQALES